MTSPPPRPDARREQRRAIDVKAMVEVNGRAVSVRTRDVSRSGMCLISDAPIATNTTLDIQLVLSLGAQKMSEPLWVSGSAVWCTALFGRYQVGVMFVDLDEEQARFLDLFMRFMDGDVRPAGYDPGPEPKPERPEDKDDPFRP